MGDLIDQLDLSAITTVYGDLGTRLPAVSPGDVEEGLGVRLLVIRQNAIASHDG
jgi:hypothetical protein